MPTKPNRWSQQQNYVPKGNGDASGEYADDGGLNIHFTNFKKPIEASKKETKQIDNISKNTNTIAQETIDKLKRIDESMVSLIRNTENKDAYVSYKNKKLKIMSTTEYENLDFKSYAEMYSYIKVRDLKIMDDEAKDKLADLLIEEIGIDLTLPSYKEYGTDENLASLDLSTPEGKARLMRQLMFGEHNQENNSILQQIFTQYYSDVIDKVTEKTQEKINKARIELGDKYIESNFKKVNNGYTTEDALKKTNPNYKKIDGYDINCQRCTYTYELLRRGYDVEVLPNDNDYGAGRKWTMQMCYKEQHNITATNYKGIKKQADEIIKKAGNGARFAIGVQWKGCSGHCFIGENVNGEVKYFDAQTNNNDVSGYFSRVNANSPVFIGRMDNAGFSGQVKYTAKGV